ncbi:(2Fe-2S)-binding protein [Paenibacillus albicereus]|uniref:(2Fe-2S)-binding protein n=1 Tax=Paenibacillus albicereus TaxID=2726185 RepID=A0A6H2GTF0_9BACL|nr:(2Fe-2S)-binding protein [Paenibacillus albicereus]QJC50703.1 (2Fe-2S)-binding protein [Paenibacillus albicereus]
MDRQGTKETLYGKLGLLETAPEGVRVSATLERLSNDPETADAFLRSYAELIPSRCIEPAATYFPSWLRSLAGAFHYLLASGSGSFPLDPSRWEMVLYQAEGASYASIGFRTDSLELQEAPRLLAADQRCERIERFYGLLVAPVFRQLAGRAGVRTHELWRLAASGLHHTKSFLLQAAVEQPELLQALEQDFAYAVEGMPGEAVGERRNPLAIRLIYVDSPYEPGTKLPLRGGCCLAFKTEYAKYCYNCPRLKPEERSSMYEELCAARS